MNQTGPNIDFTNTAQSTLTSISTRNISVLEGCRILHFDDFIPWDNPDNEISEEVASFAERLTGAIVLPILFLIGGPANVINMAVFAKQGLRERINLCLFVLSLADELYLIECMFINGENIHRQFTSSERIGPLYEFIMNNNLLVFFGFIWVSQVMSAIIASERCFCVLSPFRSQLVLGTRTMAIIIVVVFFVVLGPYYLAVTRYRVVCVYDPIMDVYSKTIDGGEFYYKHQELINYLISIVYAVLLPGLVMVVVMGTTIVTIVRLRKASAWRSETSSGTLSSREVALTKMLVGTSLLYIVCVVPFCIFGLTTLVVSDVNPGRRYHNMFHTLLYLSEIPSYINSCFNIFIYYSMGSRYRQTLRALCRRRPLAARSSKISTLLTHTEGGQG